MSDLERELESELRRYLDPIAGMPVPARRVAAQRGNLHRLLGGAGAALALKVGTGVAVAAAAATVAAAASTGSLDPNAWGQHVRQQVTNCKAQLTDGQHGVGDCVSDFTGQHGAATANDAKAHGNPQGQGQGSSTTKNDGSSATAQGTGTDKSSGNDTGNTNLNGGGNTNANGSGNGNGSGNPNGHPWSGPPSRQP